MNFALRTQGLNMRIDGIVVYPEFLNEILNIKRAMKE